MTDRRLYVIRLGYGDGIPRWIEKIYPDSGAAGECSLTTERNAAKLFTANEAFLIQNTWRATDRIGSCSVQLAE